MCCQTLQKLTGSVGVFFTALGFLSMSGGVLLGEGLGGILAQSIWSSHTLRWWERLLLSVLWPFFKFLGFIPKTQGPGYVASNLTTEEHNRKMEMRILMGGGLILLGSLMQIFAYWMV
jgi:hypothetical protein